ncbi:patatin-like phospholipase family protein [Hymenobacter rubripertinctus]
MTTPPPPPVQMSFESQPVRPATIMVESAPTAATAGATTPVSPPTPETLAEPTFDIGLVMAGAVSAGAYTAGVVTFLFQALNAWYDQDQRQQDGWPDMPQPPHQVKLKTMAGASAGGMCAALTAVSALKGGDTSQFYRAWVKDIDVRHLLRPHTDPAPPTSLADLPSLLNCDQLDRVAQEAMELPDQPQWPGWLGNDLNFYLTLTNLNGLVYEVKQHNGALQRFTDHADQIQYRLLKPGAAVPDVQNTPSLPSLRILRAEPKAQLSEAERATWQELGRAALATGSFPVALRHRELRFDKEYYEERLGKRPRNRRVQFVYAGLPQPAGKQPQQLRQPPQPPYAYPAPFLFVDGGVTNNEPLELVRVTLNPGGKNRPRKGSYGLLMIDPFPDSPATQDYQPLEGGLHEILSKLFTVFRNQARYRTSDLLQALNLGEYSRFSVAPVRRTAGNAAPVFPSLASGSVYAFGGFLHEPFREHDFWLGQRNCQHFLREWFMLPDTADNNWLFANWPTDKRKELARLRPGETGPDAKLHLPIIPLIGAKLNEEIAIPNWQAARMPEAKLRQEIEPSLARHIGWLTRLLKQDLPDNPLFRLAYSWPIEPWLRKKTIRLVRAKLWLALHEDGLLNPGLSKAEEQVCRQDAGLRSLRS